MAFGLSVDKLWKNRHKWMVYFWILMGIPTVIWWKESVLWVALMSLYANIESSAAAREAQKKKN